MSQETFTICPTCGNSCAVWMPEREVERTIRRNGKDVKVIDTVGGMDACAECARKANDEWNIATCD